MPAVGAVTDRSREIFLNGKNENGDDTGSGIYFFRLKARDFIETKWMVLI